MVKKPISEKEFIKLLKIGDISGEDLSNINFQKINKKTPLININFSQCNFGEGANLSGIDFTGSNFEEIRGKKINFNQSILNNCNFKNSYLEESNFWESYMDNTSFDYSQLKNSRLTYVKSRKISFRYADITGTELSFYGNIKVYNHIITGLRFNNKQFISKDIPQNKFYIDPNKRVYFRCSQVEDEFIDFCRKGILFRYKKEKLEAIINYNEDEKKFSLIFKENISLPGGNIWKNCLYYVRKEKNRINIINYCTLKENQPMKIDLEREVSSIKLNLVRPIKPGFLNKNQGIVEEIYNKIFS